jgi:phage terminase small subunit
MPAPSAALNAKQLRFANEYLVDHNGTRAAIRAGYSKKTAESIASRLLRNVKVKTYIASKVKKHTERMEITQQRTIQEMGRLAFSDLRRMYNEDGTLKGIHQMDDDIAAAISRVEVEETKVKGKVVGKVSKVWLWGKDKPLENLAKHFHIFEEVAPVVINNKLDVSQLSKEELKTLLTLKQKAQRK